MISMKIQTLLDRLKGRILVRFYFIQLEKMARLHIEEEYRSNLVEIIVLYLLFVFINGAVAVIH